MLTVLLLVTVTVVGQPAAVFKYNTPFASVSACEEFRKSEAGVAEIGKLRAILDAHYPPGAFAITTECKDPTGQNI